MEYPHFCNCIGFNFHRYSYSLIQGKRATALIKGEWKDWNWGQLYFNNDILDGMNIHGLKIGTREMEWLIHPEDDKLIIVTVTDTVRSARKNQL